MSKALTNKVERIIREAIKHGRWEERTGIPEDSEFIPPIFRMYIRNLLIEEVETFEDYISDHGLVGYLAYAHDRKRELEDS